MADIAGRLDDIPFRSTLTVFLLHAFVTVVIGKIKCGKLNVVPISDRGHPILLSEPGICGTIKKSPRYENIRILLRDIEMYCTILLERPSGIHRFSGFRTEAKGRLPIAMWRGNDALRLQNDGNFRHFPRKVGGVEQKWNGCDPVESRKSVTSQPDDGFIHRDFTSPAGGSPSAVWPGRICRRRRTCRIRCWFASRGRKGRHGRCSRSRRSCGSC